MKEQVAVVVEISRQNIFENQAQNRLRLIDLGKRLGTFMQVSKTVLQQVPYTLPGGNVSRRFLAAAARVCTLEMFE